MAPTRNVPTTGNPSTLAGASFPSWPPSSVPSTSAAHPPPARSSLLSFPWPPPAREVPGQGNPPPSPLLSGFPSLPPDFEMQAPSRKVSGSGGFPMPPPKDSPVDNTGFPSWPPTPRTSASNGDFPSWPPPAPAAPAPPATTPGFPSWPPSPPGPAATAEGLSFPSWPPTPPAHPSPPSSRDRSLPPTGAGPASPPFPSWPPPKAGRSRLSKEPAEVGPIRNSRSSRASRSTSQGSSRSRHHPRREDSPVFIEDVDPEGRLFRMPLPYHAIPAPPEDGPPGPQLYDAAFRSRLREGASATRLQSLRKRRPHRFKIMLEGTEMIVTKSSGPGEGGYVLEGEGLPENLPPGSDPGPAFIDDKGLVYWHVKKVHSKRINPETGEEEFEVEWEGYREREWLPAANVAGLPDAQALMARGSMYGPV